MFRSLQIVRGLAAWAVVFSHIEQSFFRGNPPNNFWKLASEFGFFGVDVFFVLSGVVMAMVSEKYHSRGGVFLLNRVFRVMPVYWFYTGLIALSILILPAGTYITNFDISSLVLSSLLIPNENPNGYGLFPTLYVGWTLTYELFFYLVFSLVLLFKLPRPAFICALLLPAIAFLLSTTSVLGHSSYLLIEFTSGILIFLTYKKFGFALKSVALTILGILAVMVLGYLLHLSLILKAGLASMIIVFMLWLEPWLSNTRLPLQFFHKLGDYSYSTYLCHVVIIGWAYHLKVYFNIESDAVPIFGIIICTWLISTSSFRLVENNKSITRLKRHIIETWVTKPQ